MGLFDKFSQGREKKDRTEEESDQPEQESPAPNLLSNSPRGPVQPTSGPRPLIPRRPNPNAIQAVNPDQHWQQLSSPYGTYMAKQAASQSPSIAARIKPYIAENAGFSGVAGSERGPAVGGTGYINTQRLLGLNMKQGQEMAAKLAERLRKKREEAQRLAEISFGQFDPLREGDLSDTAGYDAALAAAQDVDQESGNMGSYEGIHGTQGGSFLDAYLAAGSGNTLANEAKKTNTTSALQSNIGITQAEGENAKAAEAARLQAEAAAAEKARQMWAGLNADLGFGSLDRKPTYEEIKNAYMNHESSLYGKSQFTPEALGIPEELWGKLSAEEAAAILSKMPDTTENNAGYLNSLAEQYSKKYGIPIIVRVNKGSQRKNAYGE